MFDSTSTTASFPRIRSLTFNAMFLIALTNFSSILSVVSSQRYGFCKSDNDCNDKERCYHIHENFPKEFISYATNKTCKSWDDCKCLSNLIPPQSKLCSSPNHCSANETCYILEGPDTYSKKKGWCTSCENAKRLLSIPPLVDLSTCSNSEHTDIECIDPHSNPNSTCKVSAHCKSDKMCMALTQFNVFSACSRRLFSSSFITPCFCMDILETSFMPYDCTVNNDNIPIRETMHTCMSCSSIENLSPGLPYISSLCKTTFPVPPSPRVGEWLSSNHEKCSSRQRCKKSLECKTQDLDGRLTSCPEFPLDHSCFCFNKNGQVCNIVLPCKRNQMCVRLSAGGQFCTETADAYKFQQQLHRVSTVPWWFSISLFSIEMIFICLKSASINHTKEVVRIFGGLCFILESISGLALTLLQLFVVMLMRTHTRESIHWAVQLGALLFVVSEFISIISEGINVRRKIAFEIKIDSSLSNGTNGSKKSRFPKRAMRLLPLRRVVAKYISIAIGIICLFTRLPAVGNALYEPHSLYDLSWIFIVLFCYIILHTIIFLKFKQMLWSRIISACLFLTVSSAYTFRSIISVLKHQQESYCFDNGVNRFYFGITSIISIFSFSLSIFNSTISGFHLKGYRETGKITQDQIHFVEAAIIGPAAAMTVMISDFYCDDNWITILSVGFPQIAVLLFPILLEYAIPLWSMGSAFYIKSITWLT